VAYDTCATALVLTGPTGSISEDNTTAGGGSPDVFFDLGFTSTTNRMWFKYTALTRGLLRASLLPAGGGTPAYMDIGIWIGSCAALVPPEAHPPDGPNLADTSGSPLSFNGAAFEYVVPFTPPGDQPVDYVLEVGDDAWIVVATPSGESPGTFALKWSFLPVTLRDRWDNWDSGIDVTPIVDADLGTTDYIRHAGDDWMLSAQNDVQPYQNGISRPFPALDATVTQRSYGTFESDGETLWCVVKETAVVTNPYYCVGHWGTPPFDGSDVDYPTWSPERVAVFRWDTGTSTWIRVGNIEAETFNVATGFFGDYQGVNSNPRASADPARPGVVYVCWGEAGHQGAASHESNHHGGVPDCPDFWTSRLVLASFGPSAPFGEVDLYSQTVADHFVGGTDPYHMNAWVRYDAYDAELLSGVQTRLFLSPLWTSGTSPYGTYVPTVTEAQVRCYTVNDDGTITLEQTLTYAPPLGGWQAAADSLMRYGVEPNSPDALTRVVVQWASVGPTSESASLAYQVADDLSTPFDYYDGIAAHSVVNIDTLSADDLTPPTRQIFTDRFDQTWIGNGTNFYFFDRLCTVSWLALPLPYRLHPHLGSQIQTFASSSQHLYWDELTDTVRISARSVDATIGVGFLVIWRLGEICVIGVLTSGAHIWQRYSA
jgi:hypothetical protein